MDGADSLGEPIAMRMILAAALVLAFAQAAAAEERHEIVPAASRNVTAPGMTPGPAGNGPLEREAVPPPAPEPPRWRRFFLPETTDAATFKIKDRTIEISGVAPPKVDATCKAADGTDWPCGQTALHALRMFLHGRAIECYYPPAGDAELIVAPCRAGKTDLGLWLLSEGWGKPDGNATDEYRGAAKDAACDGKGIWRDAKKPADCKNAQ
jgi:endonuclease YncB( thermonuclease family)